MRITSVLLLLSMVGCAAGHRYKPFDFEDKQRREAFIKKQLADDKITYSLVKTIERGDIKVGMSWDELVASVGMPLGSQRTSCSGTDKSFCVDRLFYHEKEVVMRNGVVIWHQ